ncbi:Protein of unknown function [Nocardioides lianchengensis]|uniref:DUF2510 domain-containing protein n=2 Tax=Nocardioides lianchengensis TaxID=1045774 RepID=A0A1G6JSL6_9ACTN|nr:Protein of unknown function [Nocardioides lianchengensis]
MVDTQRYWDGKRWTDHIAPATNQPPVATTEADRSGLIAAGIVTSILIPIIGGIIGIVLIAKDRVGPGLGCIVIALISGSVWYQQVLADPYGY